MATDQSTQPQLVKRNDAYTGLLAISFLAMVGGCVLLYLEYDQYETLKPPGKVSIDVPGTLRPAPTPPKEAPPKQKEPENPDNPDNPMPKMDKEKVGRLPTEGSGDALVIPIPIPEPGLLPVNEQTIPAQAGVGSSSKRPEAIIPASATEPVAEQLPMTAQPTPMREPSLEEPPPLKVKPFIPPM